MKYSFYWGGGKVEYIDLERRTLLSVPGHDPSKKYEFGVLTQFAYKVSDSDEEIIVATTRLETMLGDSAVAVHPNDPRYTHLHGKFVVHPFRGENIPIVTDAELVDMEFGTGAVKITPAHDFNDFKCGKRHSLPEITVFDENGAINENGAPFTGMMRFDARVEIAKALEEKGLLRGKEDNKMRLGICSRSGDVIEPMLKPQWWVDCKDMAARACDAVRSGDLEIIPEFHKDTWFNWLENIQDWCISRQLWWGHRIPAYHVTVKSESSISDATDSSNWIVAHDMHEAVQIAQEKFGKPVAELEIVQDEDVLDTWFSSGLFPFSVFGWPENTPELEAFYPTALLETGHDILFFWVARMVMQGLQLTNRLPFKQVYLHAMVRDKYGRKMSKSLGNIIDPIEVIEGCTLEELHQKLLSGNLDPREVEKAKQGQKLDYPEGIPECGADALRFGLLAYTLQGRDVNLDINRVIGYRHFCNKLWNATRFALTNFGSDYVPPADVYENLASRDLAPRDRWILSRLSTAAGDSQKSMVSFLIANATTAAYNFWLYELCDVYLESIKPVMRGEDEEAKRNAQDTLFVCLDYGLRLLHPFMPFVTEELWQRLPRGENSSLPETIMLSRFPTQVAEWDQPILEEQHKTSMEVVRACRNLMQQYNILPKQNPQLYISCRTPDLFSTLSLLHQDLVTLTKANTITLLEGDSAPPSGCAVNILSDICQAHLLLQGLVDFASEIKKLTKKKGKVQEEIDGLLKKMSLANYEEKVPQDVREQNSEKMAAKQKEFADLDQVIDGFSQFLSEEDLKILQDELAAEAAAAEAKKKKKEQEKEKKKEKGSSKETKQEKSAKSGKKSGKKKAESKAEPSIALEDFPLLKQAVASTPEIEQELMSLIQSLQ